MKQPRSCGVVKFAGAPCRIRTYDALIRSQVLYPAEVRALKTACLFKHSTVWVSTITLKTATECSRCAISAPLSHSRRSCVVPAFRPLCTRAALTPRPRRARVAPAPTSHPQSYEPITLRKVRDADKKGLPEGSPRRVIHGITARNAAIGNSMRSRNRQPRVTLRSATACGPAIVNSA